MSVYLITYRDRAKVARPVSTAEEFRAIRNSLGQQKNLELARGGDSKAKLKLVQFNYSGHYPNGVLKGNKLVSNAFGIDIDDPQEYERIKKLLLDEAGQPTPLAAELSLLMVERSVRNGGHLIFRREQGRTILENQVRVAQRLDCEIDTNTHDVNRVLFATSATTDDLPYLSNELFEDHYDEEAVRRESALLVERERNGQEVLPEGAHSGQKHFRASGVKKSSGVVESKSCIATVAVCDESVAPVTPNVLLDSSTLDSSTLPAPLTRQPLTGEAINAAEQPLTYKGILYSDIIAKYWELYNDGKEPTEGDRNAKTFELALAMRSICDFSLDKLLFIIPRYDGLPETEWRQTIENALNEPKKGMPWRTRQVLKALNVERCIASMKATQSKPPTPPKRLPKVLRTLLSKVPDYWKHRYAPQLFASLASHLHGVTFRHWDGVAHTPTFMSVFCGPQSSGKGRVNDMIDYITADIIDADKAGRAREAEWKRKNPTGKSKAKDPRPEDILIRYLADNLTEAVFNQRIIDCDANGKYFIYTRVDELESLKNLTSRRSSNEVSLLIRKAFDNAMGGQERVGPDSVNGLAPIRWNFNASTTPARLRAFFKGYVTDGTITRLDLNLLMVDPNDPDYTPPVVGIYDDEYAAEIKPIIDNLNNASGEIECPQARRLAIKLRDEYAKLAEQMESKTFERLSFRANVLAYLRGMVLYIASGYKWDKDIEAYVRYSMQQDLYSKTILFGDIMQAGQDEEDGIMRQPGPQNMLELLGDEFDEKDYQQLRASLGKTGDGKQTLRTWTGRHYIYWDEIIGKYCKTEEYLRKH